MKPVDLEAWNEQPNLARELAEFLGTKTGSFFLAVLKRKFGPQVDTTPVVPGVDYTQVFAFRGNSYEACQKVFNTIEQMAIPRPAKPEPKEPTAGFHSQLLREPEKEAPAAKPVKPTRKKK